MPICQIKLKRPRPRNPAYPDELKTLGDHILTRRLDLGLLQKDVAEIIGVTKSTVCYWENGRTEPEFWHLPKIVEFLGYAPEMEATTPGQRIVLARKLRGMSQKAMAKELGVDPTTLARWERDEK